MCHHIVHYIILYHIVLCVIYYSTYIILYLAMIFLAWHCWLPTFSRSCCSANQWASDWAFWLWHAPRPLCFCWFQMKHHKKNPQIGQLSWTTTSYVTTLRSYVTTVLDKETAMFTGCSFSERLKSCWSLAALRWLACSYFQLVGSKQMKIKSTH